MRSQFSGPHWPAGRLRAWSPTRSSSCWAGCCRAGA